MSLADGVGVKSAGTVFFAKPLSLSSKNSRILPCHDTLTRIVAGTPLPRVPDFYAFGVDSRLDTEGPRKV